MQARTYDFTRGASPTVVRAVTKHLGDGDGRLLLDVAGGTGNYTSVFSARGFRAVALDAELAMLRVAARKVGAGRCVAGDALALPIRDAVAQCAAIINALHLFADVPLALREARRVLSEGPLVLTAITRENLAPLFVYGYFGLEHPLTHRPAAEEMRSLLLDAGFREVREERYVYTDTVDGSLNSLHTSALHLAGPAYLRNTSFWHRLEERTRRRGLEALARDLRSGVLQARVEESLRLAVEHGHGTVFAAWP